MNFVHCWKFDALLEASEQVQTHQIRFELESKKVGVKEMEMGWTYPRVLSTIMEVCLRNKVDMSEALVLKLVLSNQIGRRKEKGERETGR